MGCLLTGGITKECAHTFGGLKELLIGNFDDIDEVTYDVDGSISGITMISGATTYEFEFVKDTAQALEELVENGASSYINQTINLQLGGINQEKKIVLEELSLGKFFVIVKKSDDLYWMYGEPKNSAGLEATALTIDTGTAQSDVSSASVTLVGASLGYANSFVDKTAVPAPK
jgi:hypothetical protein